MVGKQRQRCFFGQGGLAPEDNVSLYTRACLAGLNRNTARSLFS